MQPDGALNPSADPPDSPNPSDSGASYWLARTIWALGEGCRTSRDIDPDTGRTLDGIKPDGIVNRNSGAESTIHGLLSMLLLDSHSDIATLARVAGRQVQVTSTLVEAEQGELSGAAEVVTPPSAWTGDSLVGWPMRQARIRRILLRASPIRANPTPRPDQPTFNKEIDMDRREFLRSAGAAGVVAAATFAPALLQAEEFQIDPTETSLTLVMGESADVVVTFQNARRMPAISFLTLPEGVTGTVLAANLQGATLRFDRA